MRGQRMAFSVHAEHMMTRPEIGCSRVMLTT
jgi:hypothetical protein